MVAIRAPFSAVGGAVCSVALFLGLARLVNVPFEVGERVPVDPVVFTPPHVDNPIEPRPRERVDPIPPVLEPGLPGFTIDDPRVIVEPVRYTRPTLVARPGSSGIGLRGVDGEVTPIFRHPPEYPARAIYSATEGWVRVQFTVTRIGTVRGAVVVDSEPGTLFDDAALKAIARWRYQPRVEDGEAVERVGLQTMIRFELED